AGTSSSQSFSYTGYHHLSVSGGSENLPPDGSGLRLAPTKPNSFTQRSSSGITPRGSTPGDCGSWQTPTKFSGYNRQTRWMSSLQCSLQCLLVVSLPTWWPMALARGEKIVTSVPRERCNLSCAFSRESRIWSSLTAMLPLAGASAGVFSASVCCLRQALSGSGAVV